MPNPAAFWDRLAERYARQPVADEASYQKKLTLTRRYLRSDSQVLEFGCGTGSTALAHAPLVAHIEAMDVSGEMIRIAQDKARIAAIDNVQFRQGDIAAVCLPAAHYDAVLGLSILHLLADPAAVMARVWRSLKPGGVFVTSTVCMSGRIRLAKPVFALGRWLGLMPQVNMFDRTQLKAWLEGAGFVVLEEFNPNRGVCFLIVQKPAERVSEGELLPGG